MRTLPQPANSRAALFRTAPRRCSGAQTPSSGAGVVRHAAVRSDVTIRSGGHGQLFSDVRISKPDSFDGLVRTCKFCCVLPMPRFSGAVTCLENTGPEWRCCQTNANRAPFPSHHAVRAMDITLILMARGFIYLAAVLDWFTPAGSGPAGVDHAGGGFLHRSCRGGTRASRQARCFQTRPGQAVHLLRLHQGVEGSRDQDQHRRQSGRARQRLRRAPLAGHYIRRGLPAGIRRRPGGPNLRPALSGLLLHPMPPFIA